MGAFWVILVVCLFVFVLNYQTLNVRAADHPVDDIIASNIPACLGLTLLQMGREEIRGWGAVVEKGEKKEGLRARVSQKGNKAPGECPPICKCTICPRGRLLIRWKTAEAEFSLWLIFMGGGLCVLSYCYYSTWLCFKTSYFLVENFLRLWVHKRVSWTK